MKKHPQYLKFKKVSFMIVFFKITIFDMTFMMIYFIQHILLFIFLIFQNLQRYKEWGKINGNDIALSKFILPPFFLRLREKSNAQFRTFYTLSY